MQPVGKGNKILKPIIIQLNLSPFVILDSIDTLFFTFCYKKNVLKETALAEPSVPTLLNHIIL